MWVLACVCALGSQSVVLMVEDGCWPFPRGWGSSKNSAGPLHVALTPRDGKHEEVVVGGSVRILQGLIPGPPGRVLRVTLAKPWGASGECSGPDVSDHARGPGCCVAFPNEMAPASLPGKDVSQTGDSYLLGPFSDGFLPLIASSPLPSDPDPLPGRPACS